MGIWEEHSRQNIEDPEPVCQIENMASLFCLTSKEATVVRAKFAMVKWKKKLEWVASGEIVKMTLDFTLRWKDIGR